MVYMVSNPAKPKYFTSGVRMWPDSNRESDFDEGEESMSDSIITSKQLHDCFDSNGVLRAPSQQQIALDLVKEKAEDKDMSHVHPDFYTNLPDKAKSMYQPNRIKLGKEPDDLYAQSEWRTRWRFEKEFERDDLPVHCIGFEGTVKLLKDCGWTVTLEYNRFMGTRKLAFRHKDSGLMCRVAYEASNDHIQLPMLYAVKNYKMKAAKFTEIVHEMCEDNIPELLEWIREVKRPKISEIVWDEHKEKARNKVVELAAYFKDKIVRKEVA